MTDDRSTPRLAIGTLVALCGAKLLLHLAAITHYGYFRDEFYYLACTEHLGWGFVDHPPLSIAVLAVVRSLLGDSLVAVRIVPVAAGIATVFLAGVIARQFGGGRFGQGLAALAAVIAPAFLGTGHFYSMNAIDLLLWAVAALALLRALDDEGPRYWIVLGFVLGLGLLNKASVFWLGGGIALGLLLTPHRRVFMKPWPWVAGSIAAVMFLPHLLWQVKHGWPTLEFIQNATSNKMAGISLPGFLVGQLLSMNPGSAPIWISGIFFGLFGRERRLGRVLVIVYLTVFALLVVRGSVRSSYLIVAYPMLLAVGAAAIERFSSSARRRWIRPALVSLAIVTGVSVMPMALPLLPIETFVRYQSAIGAAPATEERHEMGDLPQHYADMFGWEQMTGLVSEAYERLSPEEQSCCRVLCWNYGQAGAVDVLGRKLGLPRAISGHNSYWLWGPGDAGCDVLIIISAEWDRTPELFEDVEFVGKTSSRWSMPYERDLDVLIARHPKTSLREVWPRLKSYN